MNISFELLSEDNKARLGLIKTPRGNIHTPAFMPVGTLATIKGLTIEQVLQTKSEIILCNTYLFKYIYIYLLFLIGLFFNKFLKFLSCIFIICIFIIKIINF